LKEDNLNLITYNAKGLDDFEKRRSVFVWLKELKADIIFLQESHSHKNKEKAWKREWGADIIFAHGESNARGVCILLKENLNYEIINKQKDKWGRILIVDIKINNTRLSLCNLYAPNDDTPEFFDQAFNLLSNLDNEYMIVGGDFNLVFNTNIDKKGGRPTTHVKCKQCLLGWMEEFDLIDIWRHDNPQKFKYTWKSYRKPFVFCRLDFFLISFSLTNISKYNKISPGFRSDHNVVKTSIMFEPETRGPGFWKLNCSLLDNSKYENAIIECLANCKIENPNTGRGLLWDTIKCRIRGTSIKFSSNLKREKTELKKELNKNLNSLKENLPNLQDQTRIDACICDISKIEKELESIYKKESEGIRIRSKTLYYEQGEKSTKYFHALERRNQENKNIKLLENDNGDNITGAKNILAEEVKFYQDLYESKMYKHSKTAIENSYNWFINEAAPENEVNVTDISNDFKEDDVKTIIDTFACNKSPGSDGLPIEFYKKFWVHIKEYLLDSYAEIWETGELSLTQRQGVITLIPKKGKNTKKLQNWRPITLLNTDYKILTKYVSYYMKEYLNDMINYNQKGFLSGRFIGENINNAFALIDYCKVKNLEGILIFLDYNKAFDCVEWNLIHKALKFFGFKDNLVKWINAIYNNTESYIVNNGHISNKFRLYRGLRQGCPLSPYLFLIIVELLAIQIRKNVEIKGIEIGDYISKLHQYADDTFISILNDNKSVQEVFRTIEEFSIISGLTLNINKTEVLYIGKKVNNANVKKEWVKNEVTLLGIKVSEDQNIVQTNNYAGKHKKIIDCLKIWQQRNLSLIGRIHILKSLAGSQLVYNWSTIPNPTEMFFKEVEKTMYNFLWNSSTERIKRNYMIGKYEEGGLKMLDIRSQSEALKLKWIGLLKEIVDIDRNDVWRNWVKINIPKVDITYFLRCNISPNDVKQVLKFDKNSFWLEVFTKWFKLTYNNYPMSREEVYGQTLWYNSLIKIDNKMIFQRKWYDHGIKFLSDLIKEGTLLTPEELSSKYDLKINFLELLSISKAIPKDWKNQFVVNNVDKCEYLVDTTSFTCKALYDNIVNRKVEYPECYVRYWETVLEVEIDEWDWFASYTDCIKWTCSTKLRSFFFQLRNLDIMSNVKLCHMKKITDPNCEWCSNGRQDIVHLFWNCPIINKIWADISNWISSRINCKLEIKKELIFLYDIEAGNFTNIINLMVLIVCRYIYVSHCIKVKPNTIGAVNKIIEIEKMERNIATKKGKLISHIKKWSTVIEQDCII